MKNTRPFGAICIDQFDGSPELSRLVGVAPAATAVAPEPLLAVPLSLLLPGLELDSPPVPGPSSEELCLDWFWASDDAEEEADRTGATLAWIGGV